MSAKLSSSLVMRQPLFFSRGPSCFSLIIPRGRIKYAVRSGKFVAKTSLPLSNSQVLPRYVFLFFWSTFKKVVRYSNSHCNICLFVFHLQCNNGFYRHQNHMDFTILPKSIERSINKITFESYQS